MVARIGTEMKRALRDSSPRAHRDDPESHLRGRILLRRSAGVGPIRQRVGSKDIVIVDFVWRVVPRSTTSEAIISLLCLQERHLVTHVVPNSIERITPANNKTLCDAHPMFLLLFPPDLSTSPDLHAALTTRPTTMQTAAACGPCCESRSARKAKGLASPRRYQSDKFC